MNQTEDMNTPEKTYMTEHEFISRISELIPAPNAETNHNLLELANGLWFEMKDDLYHAFSFVSRHFTTETLQNVYNLCGTQKAGLLPWEIIGAAVYLQTGTPAEEISKDEWQNFVLLPTAETADAISTLAVCTVRENGHETQFYTPHFGQYYSAGFTSSPPPSPLVPGTAADSVDQILGNMGNKELNAQLEAVTAEKQDILDQMQALEKDENQQAMRASRQREMEEWLDRQEMRFTEYEDSITRRFVEQITVVDADTIQVKIKDVDVVIDRKLC